MRRLFFVIKKHKSAFLLSFFVGIIFLSRHFFIPLFIDDQEYVYYPLTATSPHFEEATFYALRANAVYNGQWRAGDINLAEYENSPAFLPVLNPLMMGFLGQVLGSMENAYVYSDFIFPALIFIIIYFLIFEITASKRLSLLFSSLFIFSPKLGVFIPPVTKLNLQELIFSFVPFLNTKGALYFSMFEEPKITFAFFALGFYFVLRALKRKEQLSIVPAGLFFGMMFYTYLFDWVSFLVGLGITFLIFLWLKEFYRAKQILMIIGIGALVSSIYWINLWEFLSLIQAEDLISRSGNEISHQLRFFTVWKSYLRILVLVPTLWFFAILLMKKEDTILTFLSGFLMSYFVLVNMQVITGMNPHPDHWYRTQFLITSIAVFLIFVWGYEGYSRIYGKIKWISGGLLTLFLIYFFADQFYAQYNFSSVHAQDYSFPRAKLESYHWLKNNTSLGSVVGSISFETGKEIQLHSHNKIFIPNGLNTVAPQDEIWQRLFFTARLYGFDQSMFNKLIREGGIEYDLFSAKFVPTDFDYTFLGEKQNKFPADLAQEIIERYGKYLNEPFFPPFELDYIYVGEREWQLRADLEDRFSLFEKVYDKNGVRIYKL